MPKPKAGESKQEYLKRCTSQLISQEGKETKQAFAICNSMWNQEKGLSEEDKSISLSAEFSLAAKKEGEKRKFLITAHSGRILDTWYGDLIISVDGIEYKDRVPLFLEHNRKERIGFGRYWKENGQLLFEGEPLDNEHAGQVLNDYDNGFPFEASIGVWAKQVKYLEKGTEIVNGIEVKAPIMIWEKSFARELSICSLGADDSTATIIMNSDFINNKENFNMSLEEKALEGKSPEGETLEGKAPEIKTSVVNIPAKAVVDTDKEAKEKMLYDIFVELRLMKSGLPGLIQDKLKKQCDRGNLSVNEIELLINDEKDMLDKLNYKPDGALAGGQIKVETGDYDNLSQIVVDAFSGKMSGKEMYLKFFPEDKNCTMRPPRGVSYHEFTVRSDTFTNIVADQMNKSMADIFQRPDMNAWRAICRVGRVNNFESYKIKNLGGVNNYPVVGELEPYLPLTEPGDQSASIQVFKTGGTLQWSREALANDDLDSLVRLRDEAAIAGAETLNEWIFINYIENNPAVNFQDGLGSIAIFHTNRANIGVYTLDSAAINNGRLIMGRQTQLTSGKKIRIKPAIILAPDSLELSVYDLTHPVNTSFNLPATSSSHPGAFVKSLSLVPVISPFLTNLNKWYMFADPSIAEALRVVFLNGIETPQVWTQSDPNSGTLFSHDAYTWKYEFVFGIGWINHRPVYGAVNTP